MVRILRTGAAAEQVRQSMADKRSAILAAIELLGDPASLAELESITAAWPSGVLIFLDYDYTCFLA